VRSTALRAHAPPPRDLLRTPPLHEVGLDLRPVPALDPPVPTRAPALAPGEAVGTEPLVAGPPAPNRRSSPRTLLRCPPSARAMAATEARPPRMTAIWYL